MSDVKWFAVRVLTIGFVFLLGFACQALAEEPAGPAKRLDPSALSFGKAEAMPEMNALFEPHEGWIGGDGAYSVQMTPQRTLWLFSDTWIGSVRKAKRVNATIVNNTLAIQDGRGKDAKVEFIIRKDAGGKPVAFIVPDDKRGWFWLQAGAYSGTKLYLFLSQIEKIGQGGAFGFRQIGRWLATVDNPADPPMSWHVTQRKLPCSIFTPQRELAFGAATLCAGEYLYVFGTDEDVKPSGRERYLILSRAPIATADDFATWRFYHDGRWETEFRTATRLISGMASECSVTYLPAFKHYVLIYTERGLSARILARTATAPWGSWSAAETIYQCPEVGWDKRIFCYAAKAHPSLSGGNELVVSYVANSFDFWQVANDARLYWPRFIRVPLTEAKR